MMLKTMDKTLMVNFVKEMVPKTMNRLEVLANRKTLSTKLMK